MPNPQPLSEIKFKATRLLLNKKHRLKEGRCLIEGRRFVIEALQIGGRVEMVLVTADFASQEEGRDLLRLARETGTSIRTMTAAQLRALSDTVTAQGVVAVVCLPGVPLDHLHFHQTGRSLIVGLDAVSDPGNVGTIIRSCAWFGVNGIILGEGTAELSNPKLLRSTMGAVFQVPVVSGCNLPEVVPMLTRDGYRVVVADARGADSDGLISGAEKIIIIFGSEAHGVRPELVSLADAVYGIPRYGSGDSLNVSVAVGVTLGRYRSLQG